MPDIQDLLYELDQKIRGFEKLSSPEIREDVFEAFQLVDQVHRLGLAQLAERLQKAGIWDDALEDEEVHTLFMLYDLVALDEATQVELAQEAVRPYVDSQGGSFEVLRVEEGTVHLRLEAGNGTSAEALEAGVEAALREAFPGFCGLVVHQADPRGTVRPFPV